MAPIPSNDPLNSVFGYYGKFQDVRGRFTGLPSWARAIVFVFALPGILLLALSILLLLVSILALLLLTAPVYMALRGLMKSSVAEVQETIVIEPSGAPGETGRKRVDVTVIDPQETHPG